MSKVTWERSDKAHENFRRFLDLKEELEKRPDPDKSSPQVRALVALLAWASHQQCQAWIADEDRFKQEQKLLEKAAQKKFGRKRNA